MGHIRDQAELEAIRLEVPQLHLQIEEQRARRLALEEELAAMEDTWRSREPEIRYVDRYVDSPPRDMPGQIIKGPVRYVVKYVKQLVEVPVIVKEVVTVEKVVEVSSVNSPGPFGRLGDFLDRVLRLTKV